MDTEERKRKFKLGLITTLHGRPRVTRCFLDYYANLDVPGVELWGVAAYTPQMKIDHPWWAMTPALNNPRSNKWNAAARLLESFDVDAAMVVGSDDFVSKRYIVQAVKQISAGAWYVCAKSCFFYELPSRSYRMGRAIHATFDRIGAGRVLVAGLLRQAQYSPWIKGTNRNADYALGQGAVKGVPVSWIRDNWPLHVYPILGIKGADNITSYNEARRMAKDVHPVTLSYLKAVYSNVELLRTYPGALSSH